VSTRGPEPAGLGERTDPGTAILAIVGRAQELNPDERRRLGRWTSASLRDPRLSGQVDAARDRALAALEDDRSRRRRWESASRPLYEGLAKAAGEDRRWRVAMLVTHFVALLAIVNLPAGMPPLVALALTLAAPVSAWAAWGRGTFWVGAIHAALAAAVGQRITREDAAALRRAWVNAVETEPPVPPPALGAIGALAPSALLVVTFVVILIVAVPR
jgi:hypothetical protein